MKRLALLIIALSVVLLSMSSCVSTRTRMLSSDDMANVEVIDRVETYFPTWVWFHALYNEGSVGDKAYKVLKKMARKKYPAKNVDVVNITVTGDGLYSTLTNLVYMACVPIGSWASLLVGHIQTINAEGDVISADKTYVAPKQEIPIKSTVVSERTSATEPIKNAGIPQENRNAPPPAPSTAPSADGLQKIAVYVTGDKRYINENEKKALQTSILSKLVNSGRYIAVERSEEFLSQVAAEHIKQRGGAIDETQISQLGRQFGLKFICIADINPAFNTYHVSARIIDVETAALVFMRDATSNLQTMADLKETVDDIIGNMLDSKIATPQTQEIMNAQGQMLMKAKYDDTEIYATEHFAASGSPVAIVGPKDVLTVLEEGKNYYKVRTASGKEGFAVKRDLVSSIAQFVDMRPEAPPTTRREAAERKRKEAEKRANPTTPVVTPRQEAPAVSQRQEKPIQVEVPDDKPRRLENRISLELGYHFGWVEGIASTSFGDDYGEVPIQFFSGGAKLHVDFIYADIYAYNFVLGGLLNTNTYILGKYPIDIGFVKLSPLLGYSQSQMTTYTMITGYSIGITDEQFALGSRVDIGLSKYAFVNTEYLHSFGGGSNSQSFKLGTGFDLGIGKKKKWYWRPELIYHFTRTAYSDGAKVFDGKQSEIINDGSKLAVSAHFVGLYVGLGYKWGGNNQNRSKTEVKPIAPPIQAPETRPAPSTPPPPMPPPALPRGSATPPSGDWGADDWGSDDW